MNQSASKSILILLILLGFVSACDRPAAKKDHLKLWYRQPADARVKDNPDAWVDDTAWLSALPLGNGSLGAMVFGDVNFERIQLNEKSLWSGSPDDNDSPAALAALEEIRKLLFEGKYRDATELTNRTQICKGAGSGHGNGTNVPYGSYQTLGDLWIDFGNAGEYSNYYRELDLNDAVVRINYTQNGVDFQREIFISQPDQVMVVRFTASRPGSISLSCTMSRPERFYTYSDQNQLIMEGALADGKGGVGMHYMARLSAICQNGEQTVDDENINIKEADEVIMLLSASTDYVARYPDYCCRDFVAITDEAISEASKLSFGNLLERHLEEYQKYYNRVNLELSSGQAINLPTDERIKNFRKNPDDPRLAALIFQYGRYLLISSSRPGTLPANLQGIWASKIQTPWNGDYHTNINVQMNYWPAGVTNLAEMQLPLFDLIEMLVEPGSRTAHVHYGANGWLVHPITNVWGYTAPGEVALWGLHTAAGAWLCSHIAEHYRFERDKKFIERMYLTMKGSVAFYLDWLVADPATGKLVSGPAGSPENSFIAPDGSICQISMGPSHDQQVIRQLFMDFLFLSNEMGVNDDFTQKVDLALKNLAVTGIGRDGRLMEWPEEFEEAEPGHRHMSHMFALHPGSQITPQETPELADAARKSLDFRMAHGGGHTGWSAAWLISLYARLQESEKALGSLHTVITKSTSPNLFGIYPPFQIDANFGTTAGIAEMLIQSQDGKIHLLPALPSSWKDGKVTGLKARGGFTVDMDWKSGQLIKAEVRSESGGRVMVSYKNELQELTIKPGTSVRFK